MHAKAVKRPPLAPNTIPVTELGSNVKQSAARSDERHLLARSVTRQKELALRAALGA